MLYIVKYIYQTKKQILCEIDVDEKVMTHFNALKNQEMLRVRNVQLAIICYLIHV